MRSPLGYPFAAGYAAFAAVIMLFARGASAGGEQGQVPLWSRKSAPWVAGGREFFVSPEGRPGNAGTRESPWDLKSVLEGGRGLRGGDVVWVMGGTYRGCFASKISGSARQPVVIRAIPGERAILDSAPADGPHALAINGEHSVYWGLEITNSNPEGFKERPAGYNVFSKNVKMVNCVVHDVACCGFWAPSVDSEMNGNVLYNIGADPAGGKRGSGHNIYTQNKEGTKIIKDNIIGYGFSFGIHAYTEGGNIEGFEIEGNTWFCNGLASKISGHKADCLVGGLRPASRIVLKENMGWSRGMGRCVQLGYGAENKDVKLIDNYIAGQVDFSKAWESVEMKGNTILGGVGGSGIDPARFPGNTFGGRPAQAKVFVRLNDYEPGRANVTVFNWSGADAVEVDLSAVVPAGAEFEVRNGQNYFAPPAAKGIADGKPVRLPMVGMEAAQPLGMSDAITKDEMAGREFNVFVVLSRNRSKRETPGTPKENGKADMKARGRS